jgi:hypothetical protein
MATINDRPLDILSRTWLYLDVRVHDRGTGIASYTRAVTRVYGDSVHVKFEIYDQPNQGLLEKWSVAPIVIDKNLSGNLQGANASGYSITDVAPEEDIQNLQEQAGEALNEAYKKVKSVLINMRFGSYDKFLANRFYPQLLFLAVDLCKTTFSSMNPDESALNVHMGKESFHFDNLLLTDTDQRNFSFGPKYPNKNSLFSSTVPKSTTEAKQD